MFEGAGELRHISRSEIRTPTTQATTAAYIYVTVADVHATSCPPVAVDLADITAQGERGWGRGEKRARRPHFFPHCSREHRGKSETCKFSSENVPHHFTSTWTRRPVDSQLEPAPHTRDQGTRDRKWGTAVFLQAMKPFAELTDLQSTASQPSQPNPQNKRLPLCVQSSSVLWYCVGGQDRQTYPIQCRGSGSPTPTNLPTREMAWGWSGAKLCCFVLAYVHTESTPPHK